MLLWDSAALEGGGPIPGPHNPLPLLVPVSFVQCQQVELVQHASEFFVFARL